MVTYIPGPESLLVPAAQQLAQGLSQVINPNLEAQRQLQMSIARNPAMLQQLADAEAAAPGTMERLGFGKIGAAAGAMPASAAQEYLIRNRQNVIKGMEAAQGAETAKNVFTGMNIDKVMEHMRDHPEDSFEIALKKETGQSLSEMITNRFGARVAQEGMKVLDTVPGAATTAGTLATTKMTPAQLSAEVIKQQGMDKAAELIKAGVPVTIDKFLKGEEGADTLNAIASSSLWEPFKLQVEAYMAEQRAKAAAGNTGANERLREGQAFQLLQKLRGVSLEAAYAYLHDPVRVQRLKADPSSVQNQTDKDILEVVKQVGQWDEAQQRDEIYKASRDLRGWRDQFQRSLLPRERGGQPGKQGDDQRNMFVGQMNMALEAQARAGGPAYTVSYEDVATWIPGIKRKELVYRDAQGNIVPERMVDLPPITTAKPGQTPPGTAPQQEAPATPAAPAVPGTAPTQPPAAAAPTGTGAAAPPAGAAAVEAAKASPTNVNMLLDTLDKQAKEKAEAEKAAARARALAPLRNPVAPSETVRGRLPSAGDRIGASGRQIVETTPVIPGTLPPGVNAVRTNPAFVVKAMGDLRTQTLAEMRAQFARWKAEIPPEDYQRIRDQADIQFPNSKTIKR